MAKKPDFAQAFTGRWRIVEMDAWDSDVLDEFEEAYITFEGGSRGEIAFCALSASLDVRYGSRNGSAGAEFSLEGFDDGQAVTGRGWVKRGTAGRLVGHIYIHMSDDSGFTCQRG